MTTSKTTVTLGGFALGGVSSIAWRLTTGTKPYTTTFSVPSRTWRSMSQQMGKPLDLVIHDRSRSVKIKGVYILHTIASDSPNRTSFIVADKRWKWPYKLIARDYNSAKRTGTRTLVSNVPVPGAVTKDEYDYREYSLEDGETRWTPKSALTDMLEQLDREFGTAPKSKGFVIESLPIEGEFSLQDVMMRDQGDVALAKLLSYIPGAAVYIDTEGKARVINAADLDAAERYRKRIPPATWDGEKSEMIDRSKIRPSKVIVYYQREVEAAFEFADSYADTAAALGIAAPFLENVIPTVDPETEITTTIDGVPSTRTVPAGTWVEASQWLEVMNDQKPAVSWPWTFDTISKHWLDGNLDGALGNRPNDDLDEDGNVAWRVQALKKHWRQTFRINPKYMDRIRDVQAKRVGVFDTVTGQRTPAAVWGQITIISTDKGEMINFRKDPKRRGLFTLHNTLPGVGVDLKDMPSAPLSVSMIDADIGVFHVGFIASPYGTDARHLPCFTVWESDTATPKSHSRDLVFQNDVPMSQGVRIEAGTSAEILKPQMEMKVMLRQY